MGIAVKEGCKKITILDFLYHLLLPSVFQNEGSFFIVKGYKMSESRIAHIGIIIENVDAVQAVNNILHGYAEYIIGRMGIPYRKEKISIISIVLDAPQNVSSSIAGKIGMIDGVQVKTIYSKIIKSPEGEEK
jgi:putative iron-only hydrogenase system regulator